MTNPHDATKAMPAVTPPLRVAVGARRADDAEPAHDGLAAPGGPPAPGRALRLGRRLRSGLASYRLRIVGWFIVLLAIGTAATILVVGQLLFQRIDDGIRSNLLREVEEFRGLATGNDPLTGEPFGGDVRRIFDVFLERHLRGHHEITVTFVDGALYRTSAPPYPYAIHTDAAFVSAVADTTTVAAGRLGSPVGAIDYVAVPIIVDAQPLGVFAAATFRDASAAEQGNIILAALGVGLVLLVIGSLLAWRLADRLLAPVLETAATARSISESDLSQRVEARGYDEVAELARTFNEMLDRVQSAFADQRRFLDDVGHELRTPLTIVRGHLELMDEGSVEERAKTRELVLDELDRMTRLVSELMTLAQSSRPDFLARSEVIAGELVERVGEKVSVLGERDWRLEITSTGVVSCDAQRITQAMLQLAANGVRHTEPGAIIRLGTKVDADWARFWVADDGPGIADNDQERIFERFYRGRGQARSAGSGLGLSIVRAIAEAHGGRAEVESRPGAGARFTIVIPRQIHLPAPPR